MADRREPGATCWTYRWNAQVFAAAGYVVVMPNPRGSTGYGQKFTDEINADWGGRAFDDIMAVADQVATLPYADRDRMAAAGGSYGGYMVNWLLGHTDRFKALVSHAGVYDLRSMAGETEELWFPIWEFDGMPWDNPELYAKWSPSYYVKEFKTPTLVIHGELDFRVPWVRACSFSPRCRCRRCRRSCCCFPTKGTGSASRRTPCSGTTSSWTGSASGRDNSGGQDTRRRLRRSSAACTANARHAASIAGEAEAAGVGSIGPGESDEHGSDGALFRAAVGSGVTRGGYGIGGAGSPPSAIRHRPGDRIAHGRVLLEHGGIDAQQSRLHRLGVGEQTHRRSTPNSRTG